MKSNVVHSKDISSSELPRGGKRNRGQHVIQPPPTSPVGPPMKSFFIMLAILAGSILVVRYLFGKALDHWGRSP